ncbi:hypothetical protein ASH01_21635 [Terrabacter sp. Soil811]|uniref:hypothetical protein n=1 Tax=Terrabacter sp. Soil811 TaxID=1736419 RepID=UPI0006FDCDB1|nr:hypothetical protein [Terrabacter sp. Soil811]KRF47799.1 hypothetical protein ASH01_21635 [Terrabacter sp. Soil811]
MTITTTSLTRAAGGAAAVAGLLFIGVQVNHPAMDVSSVGSTEWVLRNTAKVVLSALALGGVTGMYLRQVRQTGWLGLVGWVLSAVGFLVMGSVAFVAAYVLPTLADTAPRYVDDVLVAASGGHPVGDIGLMQGVFLVSAVAYVGGGVTLGVALFRARVLARWAAALLAVGCGATVLLSVLPHSFERPMAVPTGVALIGLGVSLWRNATQTSTATTSADASSSDAAVPAVASAVR